MRVFVVVFFTVGCVIIVRTGMFRCFTIFTVDLFCIFVVKIRVNLRKLRSVIFKKACKPVSECFKKRIPLQHMFYDGVCCTL